MLQSLDQWAFGVLLALYNLFGIADIPREPSPDWTVIERWSEQPDKTYRLIIESTTIPQKCKENPNSYVIFPQAYMGRQEIYSASYLVYTNTISGKDNIANIFNRPVISCRQLSQSNNIKLVSDSFVRFLNSMGSYPELMPHLPRDIFFFESIYLVSFSICICLAILGSILMIPFESKSKIFNFAAQDILFSTSMFAYTSGHFLTMNVDLSHQLVFLSLWGGYLLFATPYIFGKDGFRKSYVIFSVMVVLTLIAYGHRNLTQLMMEVPIFFAVPSLTYILIVVLRDSNGQYHGIEKILYCAIYILGMLDVYVNLYSRRGVVHLSGLIIIFSTLKFYKLIKKLQEKKAQIEVVNDKLIGEQATLKKISFVHDAYRQVVHDLKSPITSLNFFLSGDNFNKEIVLRIKNQISNIIGRIENDEIRYSVDWYSVALLTQIIEQTFMVKSREFETLSTSLKNEVSKLVEVFIDPIDFRVILEELIHNSIKAAKKQSVTFNVKLYEESNRVCMEIYDNGPGVDPSLLSKVGFKGVTTSGTGIGLYSIGKKISVVGGELVFDSNSSGFRTFIFLKSKQIYDVS